MAGLIQHFVGPNKNPQHHEPETCVGTPRQQGLLPPCHLLQIGIQHLAHLHKHVVPKHASVGITRQPRQDCQRPATEKSSKSPWEFNSKTATKGAPMTCRKRDNWLHKNLTPTSTTPTRVPHQISSARWLWYGSRHHRPMVPQCTWVHVKKHKWSSTISSCGTSSTAQGGGGSFKNRKPIGEVGCCESRMAERSHWCTERCLISLTLSLSFSDYLPTYLSIFYVSIYLSIFLV